jgi:serine/threonine protein kinase
MDTVPGPPPSPAPERVGERYEVGEGLGRGAMGEVRAGFDQRLGRQVAIKFLRSDMAGQPSIRERFEEEARSAARLVHPHIVAVFDTGEENGVPYLVMERLSGRTLVDEIQGGPMACEAVHIMGLQMLDALGAAHNAGLVHRDVKPGNILAAGPDSWKIGDFGIAKSLQVGNSDLTMTGMILGTPAYLAPERLAGGAATISSDIYAAGIVLYECLAGRRPLEPNASPVALLSTTAPPVTDFRPDIPPGLAAVVMRAIARDPAERFSSAQEMASALRDAGPAAGNTETVILPAADAATSTQILESPAGGAGTQVLPPIESPPPAPPPARPGPAPESPLRRQWRRPRERRRLVGAAVPIVVGLVMVVLLISHHGPATGVPGTQTPLPSATTSPANPASPAPLPSPLASALQDLQRQVQP